MSRRGALRSLKAGLLEAFSSCALLGLVSAGLCTAGLLVAFRGAIPGTTPEPVVLAACVAAWATAMFLAGALVSFVLLPIENMLLRTHPETGGRGVSHLAVGFLLAALFAWLWTKDLLPRAACLAAVIVSGLAAVAGLRAAVPAALRHRRVLLLCQVLLCAASLAVGVLAGRGREETGPASAGTIPSRDGVTAPRGQDPTSAFKVPESGFPRPRNLVLIVVDTLRADHLSCYGYQRPTSTEIDRLSATGVRFSRACAQFTRTSPSVATLLTGTYPYTHRITSCGTVLPDRLVTLAEVLSGHGFLTSGFVANPNLGRAFHFDQGFQSFDEVYLGDGRMDATRVNERVLPWIRSHVADRFFLYAHYVDPHAPYDPPAAYRDRFVGDALDGRHRDIRVDLGSRYVGSIHWQVALKDFPKDIDRYIARYDGEIRYVDAEIGRLLEELRRLGLTGNSLIVLTSDHGESLIEHHCYFNHGMFPYENNSQVPLILSYPAALRAGQVESGPVEIVDLMPTILHMLDVPRPPGLEGRSLLPSLLGSGSEARTLAHSEAGSSDRLRTSVRDGRWKVIHNAHCVDPSSEIFEWSVLLSPRKWKEMWLAALGGEPFRVRWELYDIETDPGETINLVYRCPEKAKQMKALLMTWMARSPEHRLKPRSRPDMDQQTRRLLKSLGYIR